MIFKALFLQSYRGLILFISANRETVLKKKESLMIYLVIADSVMSFIIKILVARPKVSRARREN